jgi:tetratricopeptide (TPR) repeat protein
LGKAYRHLNRYKEAIEILREAVHLSLDNGLAHYELGLTYKSIGDKQAAMQEYRFIKDFLGEDSLAKELFDAINK